MMGGGGNGNGNGNGGVKGKKKKKSRGRKRSVTSEQLAAMRYVQEWVSPDVMPVDDSAGDDFLPPSARERINEKVVFELHSHSLFSDGFLTPSALVERAYRRGVNVLALTDHDTMAGIPEAVETAKKFGIRIIPGVEISAIFSSSEGSRIEEPVHILAYYSSCGPMRYQELENCLSSIREGRYLRAKSMLLKLNKLKVPLKWEHVTRIAGNGVAPGRLHVARALLEAGYVENLRQAFNRYLHDGGPAYATGSEPDAEDVVQLICRTGGLAALAHPWALKNPVPIIRNLKAAGLHAVEVYRSDGKLAGFSDLCDTYKLMKIGGSDYHGKGGNDESDLGSISLPITAVSEFLRIARPIWANSIKDTVACFAEDPSDINLQGILRFGEVRDISRYISLGSAFDVVTSNISSWLTYEERQLAEFDDLMLKLKDIDINSNAIQTTVIS